MSGLVALGECCGVVFVMCEYWIGYGLGSSWFALEDEGFGFSLGTVLVVCRPCLAVPALLSFARLLDDVSVPEGADTQFRYSQIRTLSDNVRKFTDCW